MNGTDYTKECPGFPPFSSNLIFELYRSKKDGYIVKLKYQDTEYSACNNGKNVCTLEEFL